MWVKIDLRSLDDDAKDRRCDEQANGRIIRERVAEPHTAPTSMSFSRARRRNDALRASPIFD
jgi:hypothetical protein